MKNTVCLVFLDGVTTSIYTSSMIHILPHGTGSMAQDATVLVCALGSTLITYHSTRISDFIQYRT